MENPPKARLATEGTYLLFSNWPIHRFGGRLWSDPLWVKDLEQHLRYIDVLTLPCPVRHAQPPSNLVPISPEVAARLELVPMPSFPTALSRLVSGLRFLLRAWQLSRGAAIMHFTAAGHPILFGVLAKAVRSRGRTGIVGFVESSFWRKPGRSWSDRLLARISESCVRQAISSSHATFLSQASYVEELASPANANHVVPPVWVDEASFVPRQEVVELVSTKSRSLSQSIRIGYFGQLIQAKGPDVLVEAAKILVSEGFQVQVDIYGMGPELATLQDRAKELGAAVSFRGYLKYGTEFFQAIRRCHAMALPTRSDEQPRIVWDCFSQAVPIIASNAPGMIAVRSGRNGLKSKVGDAESMASAIRELATDPLRFRRLSLGAFASVRQRSHTAMHRRRSEALLQSFPNCPRLTPFQ